MGHSNAPENVTCDESPRLALAFARELALLDGPLRAFGWLAVEFGGREAVEKPVVGGMHGNQLSFEVG